MSDRRTDTVLLSDTEGCHQPCLLSPTDKVTTRHHFWKSTNSLDDQQIGRFQLNDCIYKDARLLVDSILGQTPGRRRWRIQCSYWLCPPLALGDEPNLKYLLHNTRQLYSSRYLFCWLQLNHFRGILWSYSMTLLKSLQDIGQLQQTCTESHLSSQEEEKKHFLLTSCCILFPIEVRYKPR